MACCTHLEGFQVVSSYLSSGSFPGDTGLTGESWADAATLFHEVILMHSSSGSCIGSGGACTCAGEALCGFRVLVWWFALFAWAQFCLGCVEPLLLPKGSETCLIQVILLFVFVWLSIACSSFFLFVSFLFLFSQVTICGCCQCTYEGGDWGPCVVRGPMDGRFLVWWVIDNVV
jgi:hypothetical protein